MNTVAQEEHNRRREKEKRGRNTIVTSGPQVEVEATTVIPQMEDHCHPMGAQGSFRGMRETTRYTHVRSVLHVIIHIERSTSKTLHVGSTLYCSRDASVCKCQVETS